MQRGGRTKEQEPVLLTLSNAVDQTQKIKVEVPPNTTIKQASIDAGVAPNGAFDVFTAGGKAVTLSKADNHRGEVLYVGPQKVAGGSDRSSSGKGDDEFGSNLWLQDHRWHRQSGLLDQEMVASLDIGLEGHDESMLGLLLELDLLGACRSGCGEVSIDRGPEEEVSIRMLRGLVDFTTSSWGEVQRSRRGLADPRRGLGASWLGQFPTSTLRMRAGDDDRRGHAGLRGIRTPPPIPEGTQRLLADGSRGSLADTHGKS